MLTTEQQVAFQYLALQKYLISLENKRLLAAKYDRPCHGIEETEKKILYYLWVFNSLDCFTSDELALFLSMCRRISGACGDCTVTVSEINAWLLTPKGISITDKI
jgi:hypothetical protein